MARPSVNVRILGIDPSLRGTGFGILDSGRGGYLRAVAHGVIRNPPALTHAACLLAIHDTLDALIREYRPDAAAIESTIYVQSVRIAVVLGTARGVALLALARHGLTPAEYAPRQIKMVAAGSGSAGKSRVASMVRALCQLDAPPQADAADALAIALTHARQLDQPGAAAPAAAPAVRYRNWAEYLARTTSAPKRKA